MKLFKLLACCLLPSIVPLAGCGTSVLGEGDGGGSYANAPKCGGFVMDAPKCAEGYKCVPEPGMGNNPDKGGICVANDDATDTAASATSGSGGASTSDASSASGGAGAIGFGGSGPGGAGGAGGTFACGEPDAAYFLDLSGDDVDQHLDSGCGQAMAWGYFAVVPADGGSLWIEACIAGSKVKLKLNARLMMVGTDNTIFASYTGPTGATWSAPAPGTMTITAYGAAGGAIDGTFAVGVIQSMPGSAGLSLSGSFHVCHRPDVFAP